MDERLFFKNFCEQISAIRDLIVLLMYKTENEKGDKQNV